MGEVGGLENVRGTRVKGFASPLRSGKKEKKDTSNISLKNWPQFISYGKLY